MAQFRLDKLLCEKAAVTRSQARELIKQGRVTANGVVAKNTEQKYEAQTQLCLDGTVLGAGGFRYFLLNKPKNVLSTTTDREQKTVVDILPDSVLRKNFFPVGRLDKDTTGLLLITDDGEFCHAVTSPKKQIPKVYEVFANGELTSEDTTAFAQGIVLRVGTACLPAKLEIDEVNPRRAFVEIYEGKYHQVKRMFASRGKPLEELNRISVGGLKIPENLEVGGLCELSAEGAMGVFAK